MQYNKIKKIQTFFIEQCDGMIAWKDASNFFYYLESLLSLKRILLTSEPSLNMEQGSLLQWLQRQEIKHKGVLQNCIPL